jgi:hypothetical protein
LLSQAVGQQHPDVVNTLNNLHSSSPHHPQGQAEKKKADRLSISVRAETNDLGGVLQPPPLTSPGASNPFKSETTTTTKEFLSNLQGKPHLKEIFANLQHVVDLMEFSSSATMPFTTTTTASPSTTTTTATTNTKKGKKQKQKNRHKGSDEDEELMAGAKLLSKGFAITSNVCGLVADGVRVSGDTTAGLLGSSVKLLGMGVKSVSTGLYFTSRLLDGPPAAATAATAAQSRKPLTAERLRRHETKELKNTSILRNTRQLAAKSVLLAGNILGGVGESIVATGMATEAYGSATVGIAEDAVRILEDFAGSLAAGFLHRKIKSKVRLRRIRQLLSRRSIPENSNGEIKDQDNNDDDESFLLLGTHPGTCDEPEVAAPYSTQLPAALVRLWRKPSIEVVETITVILGTQLLALGEFVMQDVEGVSSMATELMVIMTLLFLVSLLLILPCQRCRRIPPKPKDSGGDAIPQNIHICYNHILQRPASFADTMSTIDDSSDDWTSVVGKASEPRSSLLGSSVLWMAKWSWKQLLAATRLLRICLSAIVFVIFNRVTLLVYVYIVAWLYLSRASQLRAMSIHRYVQTKSLTKSYVSLWRVLICSFFLPKSGRGQRVSFGHGLAWN